MTDRVLVTGISGFLGGHIALKLLKAGYAVRGSVRNLDRAADVSKTLASHGAPIDKLDFAALDLLDDKGWAKAMQDVRYLQHVASPYVTSMPKDKMELIRPAVEGTERALTAATATKVERVVLTSSMVAVMQGHPHDRTTPLTGADWTDISAKNVNAYAESKTLAERRAWELMGTHNRTNDLAVINPSAILGPLLDKDPGTSGQLFLRLLRGNVPAAPRLYLPIIDVRDVADVHVAAMTAPEAGGRRHPTSDENLSIMEIARTLADALPDYAKKMPKFEMPNWLVRIYALIDADVRGNIGDLGHRHTIDASAARALLGRDFIASRDAAIALSKSLIDQNLV